MNEISSYSFSQKHFLLYILLSCFFYFYSFCPNFSIHVPSSFPPYLFFSCCPLLLWIIQCFSYFIFSSPLENEDTSVTHWMGLHKQVVNMNEVQKQISPKIKLLQQGLLQDCQVICVPTYVRWSSVRAVRGETSRNTCGHSDPFSYCLLFKLPSFDNL